jgi:hypothetical protein
MDQICQDFNLIDGSKCLSFFKAIKIDMRVMRWGFLFTAMFVHGQKMVHIFHLKFRGNYFFLSTTTYYDFFF